MVGVAGEGIGRMDFGQERSHRQKSKLQSGRKGGREELTMPVVWFLRWPLTSASPPSLMEKELLCFI